MCAMHVLELMSANLCIFLHVDMKAHVDLYVCSVNVVKKGLFDMHCVYAEYS